MAIKRLKLFMRSCKTEAELEAFEKEINDQVKEQAASNPTFRVHDFKVSVSEYASGEENCHISNTLVVGVVYSRSKKEEETENQPPQSG